MFYSKNDLKRMITMYVLVELYKDPSMVLTNTSYGSDLFLCVGIESLNGKKELLCGIKRLECYDKDFNCINQDKYAIVWQPYDKEQDYTELLVLWKVDKHKDRFTDSYEDYCKIMELKENKKKQKQKYDPYFRSKARSINYSVPVFDKLARLYFKRYGKQFKGKLIIIRRNISYGYNYYKDFRNYRSYYCIDFYGSKNQVQKTIILH